MTKKSELIQNERHKEYGPALEYTDRYVKCSNFFDIMDEFQRKLNSSCYDCQNSQHKNHKELLDFFEKRHALIENMMLSVDMFDKTELQDRAVLNEILKM